jgi:hypothetical protein
MVAVMGRLVVEISQSLSDIAQKADHKNLMPTTVVGSRLWK